MMHGPQKVNIGPVAKSGYKVKLTDGDGKTRRAKPKKRPAPARVILDPTVGDNVL
jgi:hypothetical protein